MSRWGAILNNPPLSAERADKVECVRELAVPDWHKHQLQRDQHLDMAALPSDAQQESEATGSDDWEEDDSAFFAGLPAARAPGAPKKRRERQAAVRADNLSHAPRRQEPPPQVSGTAGARRAVPEEPVADAIRKEYKLRCASAASTVPCCQASPDCLGQYAAVADLSRNVILVDVEGHASVPRPLWKCSCCGHRRIVLPPEIGYFPATPGPRPRVLYSRDVLKMTSLYEVPGGPLQAARSLSKVLAFLHASNACTEGSGQDLWRYLGEAVREWRLVNEAATRMIRDKAAETDLGPSSSGSDPPQSRAQRKAQPAGER